MSMNQYRGCMLGALVGDSIGAIYEKDWCPVPFKTLITEDKKLKRIHESGTVGYLYYTDDTEMAHGLAESLVQNKKFDPIDVAKKFSENYFKSSPKRFYGASVPEIFKKLRISMYQDPFGPASQSFNGQGSYGNGSAMRVMPVALFLHNNIEKIKEVAASSALITHAHIDAVNGAIIQALSVDIALTMPATWEEFWITLKYHCVNIERQNKVKIYSEAMDTILEMIYSNREISIDEISTEIGTGIAASQAVCAAIFSFLCCFANQQPSELNEFNKFEQTILYSISLGGDTDTIATMAGAIAGAYYGINMIPNHWIQPCEGFEKTEKLANELYTLFCQNK